MLESIDENSPQISTWVGAIEDIDRSGGRARQKELVAALRAADQTAK